MSVASEEQHLASALVTSLRRVGVTTQAEVDQVINDSVLRLRSLQGVGAAVAKLPEVPAGFTRATQATENAWKRIEHEFGLLTSTEVAARAGSRSPHRNLASDLRRRGQLIGVSRLNSYRYPGFQFTSAGAVHPVIPQLIVAAAEAGWSEQGLVLWLCNPSGSFSGDRPVDHLDDEQVVESARTVMATGW